MRASFLRAVIELFKPALTGLAILQKKYPQILKDSAEQSAAPRSPIT